MPFIGNQPALSYTSFAKQDFTTSATTSYTLDNPVANANELALFINFVRQEPTTAYSASGTTLTLTSATASSDDMYCVFLGKAVQTVNPPNASVGTAQLIDGAVTKDKVSNLMYPAFVAYRSPSSQSIPSGTNTKAIFDAELFDTDSAYDTSTGAFTVPSGKGGKYNIFFTIFIDDLDDQDVLLGIIYKNGSATTNPVYQNQVFASKGTQNTFLNFSSVMSLSDSDYIEVYVQHDQGANQNLRAPHSHFGAYRIGD